MWMKCFLSLAWCYIRCKLWMAGSFLLLDYVTIAQNDILRVTNISVPRYIMCSDTVILLNGLARFSCTVIHISQKKFWKSTNKAHIQNLIDL